MKVRENITIYECEYCHKRLLKKEAMENHEVWCNSNPENKKKCMDCIFVHTEQVTYYYDAFDGEHEAKSTAFRCTKYNKLMYPFKAEKSAVLNHPESFEKQEPMPIKCEGYEWGSINNSGATPTEAEYKEFFKNTPFAI